MNFSESEGMPPPSEEEQRNARAQRLAFGMFSEGLVGSIFNMLSPAQINQRNYERWTQAAKPRVIVRSYTSILGHDGTGDVHLEMPCGTAIQEVYGDYVSETGEYRLVLFFCGFNVPEGTMDNTQRYSITVQHINQEVSPMVTEQDYSFQQVVRFSNGAYRAVFAKNPESGVTDVVDEALAVAATRAELIAKNNAMGPLR